MLIPMLVVDLFRVALIEAVLDMPSALVICPAASELGQLDGLPLVSTSNRNKQFPPATMVAPDKLAVFAPGVAVMLVVPAQVVVALAGLATTSLVIGPSTTETPVKEPADTLLIWIVTRETPPLATEVGENDLAPVMPVVMVRVAEAVAGLVTPSLLVNAPIGMVLVCVPTLPLLTLTLKVQLPLAGMVAPERMTLPLLAGAVTVPPTQVVLAPGTSATTTIWPTVAGRLSVIAALVMGVAVALVSVTVNCEVWPWATDVGLNALDRGPCNDRHGGS